MSEVVGWEWVRVDALVPGDTLITLRHDMQQVTQRLVVHVAEPHANGSMTRLVVRDPATANAEPFGVTHNREVLLRRLVPAIHAPYTARLGEDV